MTATLDLKSEISEPAPSVITFDPSQRRLFEDPARVVAVNWHRQKGKDFTAIAKAINEACVTGQDWWVVGMTQAQADETFNKGKKVIGAMKLLLKRMFGTDEVREESESFVDYDAEIDHAFVCTARIMRLPNGARVVSLPGKDPDTLAGRTGNMLLTEFGLYPKGGYPHWDVLFPITTRGGFKFIMISTPRGKNTKFYEVFSNAEGFYSVHFCDIYKSVHEDGYQLYDAQGKPFPQNTTEERDLAIKTFRRIYNSESKWPREYECQFTGDLSSLIPWAELERAAELGKDLPFDFVRVNDSGSPIGPVWQALKAEALAGGRVEVGWDVARTNHLSAITINFNRTNRPKHLRFVVAMRNLPFEDQRAFVRAAMDLRYGSVGGGDATGLGRESNEAMEKRYKDRWSPYQFTVPGKRAIASSLVTAFGDGAQTLPALDGPHKSIATDLYAIQKDDTGGQLLLEETPNPLLPESHCDIAYSLGINRVVGARQYRSPMRAPMLHKPEGF